MKKFLGYYLIVGILGPQFKRMMKEDFRNDPEFREKVQKSLRDMGVNDTDKMPWWYVTAIVELCQVTGALFLMWAVRVIRNDK